MRFRWAVISITVASALFVGCSKSGSPESRQGPDSGGEVGSTAPAVKTGDLGMLEPQRPKVGEVAPDFALIDARDGTVRKLSDYRGKAIVLNWYASWCGPCKSEIPGFQEASEALSETVTFIGVDYRESREKAVGILDELSATYPALLDSDGKVGEHYRATGLPTTYFLDSEGVVRAIRIGEVKSQDLISNLAKVNITYVQD